MAIKQSLINNNNKTEHRAQSKTITIVYMYTEASIYLFNKSHLNILSCIYFPINFKSIGITASHIGPYEVYFDDLF